MKTKKKVFICILGLFLILTTVSLLIKVEAVTTNQTDEHIYYTDFEGIVVNENSTVDNNTGFIWANNWQATKTVQRNGTTMLEMPLFDSSTYSTVGGFGIACESNLGKCKIGESYKVQTYFEMENVDYMFVEFVGGDNKWGSVIIYEDGFVRLNPGGRNISSVSYIDNILKFTFNMSFNSAEDANGYIKFTAYNSHNGKVYIDDVSIDSTKYSVNDNLEQMPLGLINSHKIDLHSPFYAEKGTVAEYLKDNNSTVYKATLPASGKNTAASIFYINKLGVLNINREYQVSFDIKFDNINKIMIYHAGRWVENPSFITVDTKTGNIQLTGTAFTKAEYLNDKVSFDFNMYNANYEADNWQFQFVVESTDSTKDSYITMDNLIIEQLPRVNELQLDIDDVKNRYIFGEDFSVDGLKVSAIFTDGTSKVIDLSECEISGYDPYLSGKQKIKVTYKDVSNVYIVYVSRVISEINVNVSELKRTYQYGEELNLSNLTVDVSFVDGGDNLTLTHGSLFGGYSIDFGGFDKNYSGTYIISIYYLDAVTTFEVTVSENTSVSLGEYAFKATGK